MTWHFQRFEMYTLLEFTQTHPPRPPPPPIPPQITPTCDPRAAWTTAVMDYLSCTCSCTCTYGSLRLASYAACLISLTASSSQAVHHFVCTSNYSSALIDAYYGSHIILFMRSYTCCSAYASRLLFVSSPIIGGKGGTRPLTILLTKN